MKELAEIRKLFELKEVYRIIPIENRKESSAEHSWACLILADYFLEKWNYALDRQKVMDLLLYHDLVEIEAGDVSWIDEEKIKNKKENEATGFTQLQKSIPPELQKKYHNLFHEYEEGKTMEAKFAHAVDKIEPSIYIIKNKPLWKQLGITEKQVRDKKEPTMKPFPELHAFFNEVIEWLKKEGYFNQ
jgi:putative hydrolases of HD superfamily